MAYVGLGPIRVVAAADATGLNPGNYTFALTSLPFHVAWFECYHMCIPGNLPSATTLTVTIGQRIYTVAQCEGIADYDPAQPILMAPGQDIYVLTNIPTSPPLTNVPELTAWFRHDSIWA